MHHSNRYHAAQITSRTLFFLGLAGLIYYAVGNQVIGVLLVVVGLGGGIIAAIVATHDHARQLHHEDRVGAQTLYAFGQDIRRHARTDQKSTEK